VATVDYEKREPHHTWVATRISELEKGGKKPPKVIEAASVAAGPPSAEALEDAVPGVEPTQSQ
jgi:hypothetical protein